MVAIRPLEPIGAELDDIDLASLGDETFGALRAALLVHGVLVLRNQPLTHPQQVGVARRFFP